MDVKETLLEIPFSAFMQLPGVIPENSQRGVLKKFCREHNISPNPQHMNILVEISQYH